MTLRPWSARLRALWQWRRKESELDDEIQFHLAEEAEERAAEGLAPAQARAAAVKDFGRVGLIRESTREAWGWGPVERLTQDVRDGVRALKASPVVSAVAILSLALGIGANTAIFSILDSLILRTLPVTDPHRLAVLAGRDGRRTHWTNPLWEQIRDRQRMFDGAFAVSGTRFNLAPGGQTDLVDGLWASGGMFDVLGVRAILGRTFTEADDRRGGGPDGPVAVISYGFWQRRFGGAADAIGRALTLERVPFTIIGVAPPEFFGIEVGRTFDVALPIGTEPLIRGGVSQLDGRSSWWLRIMIRLKADQSVEAGDAVLRSLLPHMHAATLPPGWRPQRYLSEGLALQDGANGSSRLRERYVRALTTIMVVVVLVLLIACANIANLLLARATARRHELSLRLALGASRLRIARQLGSESLLLAGAGALLGLAFARWGSDLLVRQLSTSTDPVFLALSLDWRVLGFTATVAVTTAVLFGTGPAVRGTRAQPNDALKTQGRGVVGDARLGFGHLLIVLQVALSLVLIVAAGLFVRTFSSLANLPLGFDRHPILVARVEVPNDHVEPAQRPTLFQHLLEAASRVPGVSSAALSEITPVGGETWNNPIHIPGAPPSEQTSLVYYNAVSPGWFGTYGTTIIAGRDFTTADSAGAPRVAIVNETFARLLTPDRSPIGMRVREPQTGESPLVDYEIVGSVQDAVYESVRDPVPPTIYLPYAQQRQLPRSTMISVRTADGSPLRLVRPLAAALTQARADVAITFTPVADRVNASLQQERTVASLSSFFGALALLLAGLGLYGVTSYAVSLRRTEIGVRMALGAAPAGVVAMVLRRMAFLVAIGIVIGTVVSLWASAFVSTLLFGLQPRDPATLIAAIVILVTVGAMAGWLPARRASRIDPARVLREG